uniref:Uncharacterized protein n=1 Tax=Oryza punctata TaxID=4537 RepID=A0A0E0JLK1_ORYPU
MSPSSGGRMAKAMLALCMQSTSMMSIRPYYWAGTYDATMKVFSIGQDAFWRETSEVPPYPVRYMETLIHSKGYLFWNIDGRFLKGRPHGFLSFSLEDETLSHPLSPAIFFIGLSTTVMGVQDNKWDQRFSINIFFLMINYFFKGVTTITDQMKT